MSDEMYIVKIKDDIPYIDNETLFNEWVKSHYPCSDVEIISIS